MSSLPLAPLPWPDPVCAYLYGLCINKSRWLSRNCSFTWNLHRIPDLHHLFSWGLGWESGQGMQPPLHLSFPSLPTPFSCPSPLPPHLQGSPTLQQWQQQAKTNMEGKIVEQLPRVPTQDLRRPRREEDRANPPTAGRKKGFLGPPRLLGQRPSPARAIVGPVPWVGLKVG